MKKSQPAGRQGFTLIEALIVIGVIAILIGISAFSLSTLRERGRDAKRQSDVQSIKAALEQYYADWGFYPSSFILDSPIGLTSDTGNPNCPAGPNCPSPPKEYIKAGSMPHDPQENVAGVIRHYCYQGFASLADSTDGVSSCDNKTVMCNYYELSAKLDKPIPLISPSCDDGSGPHDRNFVVTPLQQ